VTKFTILILACGLLFATGLARSETTDLARAFREDTTGQGQYALLFARRALDYYCLHHDPLSVPDKLPPLLHERGAVFVSAMNSAGAPRCCMGTLLPREPSLAEEIVSNACAAAAHDKRFPPIKRSELKQLRLIVSIIGDSRPVDDPHTLDPVTDGLAVRGPKETGVVLPGETGSIDTMIKWGRIRAGIKAGDSAEYSRLDAVRYMEPPRKSPREDTKK